MSMDMYEAEQESAMDAFYDSISKDLYPEHKELAIDEFIKERMRSYFLKHPELIQAPIECFFHASDLQQLSPRCALVMYTSSIEQYLRSVLLKPVLFGMIHNENVAELIVRSSVGQSGFSRYKKLLTSLCHHAAEIELSDLKGIDGKPILEEASDVYNIRSRVTHQGYQATTSEMEKARNVAVMILTKVVEPVLLKLGLFVGKDEGGSYMILDDGENG